MPTYFKNYGDFSTPREFQIRVHIPTEVNMNRPGLPSGDFSHLTCIRSTGLPWWLREVKASACNVRDLGLIPGSERSPGEENSNPLKNSCLENPMDRGAWWATVHGVAKSRTRLVSLQLKLIMKAKKCQPIMQPKASQCQELLLQGIFH